MTTRVPDVIVVGQTRYRHFSRGSRDLYAPETYLPHPPPQHVWSYCVSPEHNNIVYFHNSHSGRSVWVLPRLTANNDEASNDEEETMRAIGSVESAASQRRRDASGAVHRKEEEEEDDEMVGRDGVAMIQPGDDDATKKVVVDGRGKENDKNCQVAETEVCTMTSLTPTHTRISKVRSISPTSGKSFPMVPVRERLAEWRRKREQEQKESGDGHRSCSIASRDSSSMEIAAQGGGRERISSCHSQNMTTAPNLTDGAGVRSASSKCEGEEVEGLNRIGVSSKDGLVTGNSRQQQLTYQGGRTLHDERNSLFLAASEELQREKVSALQKDCLLLEQVSRMKETQLREEEERTRLAARRREVEKRQLEIQKQVLERQRSFLAKAEEDVVKQEVAAQLDAFFLKRQQLERQVEEEDQQAISFEVAIAKSLLDSAADSSHAPPKERYIDLRLLEASDEEDAERKPEYSTSVSWHDAQECGQKDKKRKEKKKYQQRAGRISYSASLTYVGDVVRDGGREVPSFLRRQGHGTYFYDAAQKTFFKGEWIDDKKNGPGVLSLPHIALEGTWSNDKLNGRVMFQTQQLKGTGEFVAGVLEGNAVVELDCNSVFAGKVKKNASLVCSGAITLASGDHVEWIPDADEGNRGRLQRNGRSDHIAGRCRIRFSNGDMYIGQVENYKPHGTGSYHFAGGHEYIGEFHQGLLHGKGTYRFANGNVYVGQLHKGLFHGEGEYVQQGVYTYEGSWEYGTTHGFGKMIFVNGDVWEGKFDHDRRVAGRYTASRLFQL